MKLYKLLYILPFFFIASCDLDKEPYGISNFWNTEDDVVYALKSAYAPFYEEEAFGRGHYWADASDDMVINRQKDSEQRLIDFKDNVNSSGGLFENWELMYKVIRRTNDVMQHTPSLAKTEVSKNMLLAEANFTCAYAYFFLAKRYGGLPFYELEKAINGQYQKPEDFLEPRQTKAETYKRIVAYLTTSIQCFEKAEKDPMGAEVWHREGKPSLGAAYGLLAKVYAHWGKYAESKAAAEKVIDSKKYSLNLMDNNGYANLFSPIGEKHEEVLFNLVNKQERHQSTVTSVVLMSKKFTGGAGWYYFAPTKSLFNAFDPGDLRRKVTMVGAGDEVRYLGKVQTLKGEDISDMTTGYMCAKYSKAYEYLKSWEWDSGADIPLLRYADVLLLYVEAELALAGGDPKNGTIEITVSSKALDAFNAVRLRAFGGDATKKKAKITFDDLIKERRCELAYEDERHFDLVRWGVAEKIYAKGKDLGDLKGDRVFDPSKHAHFPLPQKELDNTNGILINNPADGYSNFK